MNVYVVIESYWEYEGSEEDEPIGVTSVVGVFSSIESAENYAKRVKIERYNSVFIEEVELDRGVANLA